MMRLLDYSTHHSFGKNQILRFLWFMMIPTCMPNFIFDMVQESHPTIERLAAENAHDGAHFLEIGCFVGQSTTIFCKELAKYKNVTMTCIDTWQPFEIFNVGKISNTFETFTSNLDEFPFVKAIRGDSREVHKQLPDNYYDLVFVDGDHFYAGAYLDIQNYRSKCKGTFCGHDCEMRYDELPSYLFEDLSVEFPMFLNGEKFAACPFDGVHCGVIKAVHELVQNYYVENRVWVAL